MNLSIVNIRAVTTASCKVNRKSCPNSTGFARESKYICEITQKFCKGTQISLQENAKVLRENAKVLQGSAKHLKNKIPPTTMSLKGLRTNVIHGVIIQLFHE